VPLLIISSVIRPQDYLSTFGATRKI
jgi:hypothetical protein